VSFAVDGDIGVVELEGSMPDRPDRIFVVDHFTVTDDGQIRRLAIYRGVVVRDDSASCSGRAVVVAR
jgi:hypothetical protein